jgi:arylsulfatase A-like enzyme
LPTDRVYDGVDLMPYLTGEATGAPHDRLAWRRLPLLSIREGNWKLCESEGDRSGQYGSYKLLFNLEGDRDEATNLADKNPQKLAELDQHIHQWAKAMIDPKWPSKPAVTYDVCGTRFTLPQ